MISFACIELAALPKLARITSLLMCGAKVCYQDYVMPVLRWRALVSAVRNKGNVSDSVAKNFHLLTSMPIQFLNTSVPRACRTIILGLSSSHVFNPLPFVTHKAGL